MGVSPQEEEKEPSLCPENTALLSLAEGQGEKPKDQDRAKSRCGPQGPRGVGAMAFDWWTEEEGGERGAVWEHSTANT